MKILLITIIFLTIGCATTGYNSDTGYSFIKVEGNSGNLGYDRGGPFSRGEACSYNILGLLSFGDSGIKAAKRNGGLEKVSYFDQKIVSVAALFGQVCTIAYGKRKAAK